MNWFELVYVLLFFQLLAMIFSAVMLAMLVASMEKLASRLNTVQTPPPVPMKGTR